MLSNGRTHVRMSFSTTVDGSPAGTQRRFLCGATTRSHQVGSAPSQQHVVLDPTVLCCWPALPHVPQPQFDLSAVIKHIKQGVDVSVQVVKSTVIIASEVQVSAQASSVCYELGVELLTLQPLATWFPLLLLSLIHALQIKVAAHLSLLCVARDHMWHASKHKVTGSLQQLCCEQVVVNEDTVHSSWIKSKLQQRLVVEGCLVYHSVSTCGTDAIVAVYNPVCRWCQVAQLSCRLAVTPPSPSIHD